MHRKLLPLALMYADDGESVEGRTRMQKLIFLMQQKMAERSHDLVESNEYDFIAYDYGPFSKDLYGDLDRMIEQGYIEEEEEEFGPGKIKYDYSILDDGEEFIETQLKTSQKAKDILEMAAKLKEEHNDKLLSELIDEVYSEYPEYAENSIY